MAIIRVEKDTDYTVMKNVHLKDKNLTLKAKGLLSVVLSLPNDWDYSLNGLVALCKEEITAVRSAIKELEDNKYLVRNQSQDELGKFDYEYIFYEVPYIGFPHTDNPYTEEPHTENHTQLNTNNKDTKELSTNNNSIVDSLVEAYNQLCPSLPAVQKLTNDRRAKLKTRLKTFDEDEIKACFILAEQSDFLSGRSGRWKANFDWLIKNDTTVQKVLEGAYANTINEKNMSTEDRLKKALMEIQKEMAYARDSNL